MTTTDFDPNTLANMVVPTNSGTSTVTNGTGTASNPKTTTASSVTVTVVAVDDPPVPTFPKLDVVFVGKYTDVVPAADAGTFTVTDPDNTTLAQASIQIDTSTCDTTTASVAQVDTLTLSGTWAAGDVVGVTVNGTNVPYTVVSNDLTANGDGTGGTATATQAATNIAAKVKAAVAANTSIANAVTVGNSAATVTFTAKTAGTPFTSAVSAYDAKTPLVSVSTTTANAYQTSQVSSVTIGGTPAAGNVVSATVAGTAVSYTLVSGDTTATAATGLAAAITTNATTSAVVTAVTSGSVVYLTAKTFGGSFTISATQTGTGATATAAMPTAGVATAIAQVSTAIVYGSWEVGDAVTVNVNTYTVTYTVTSNDLTVSGTGTGGTATDSQAATNITAKVVAAINANASVSPTVLATQQAGTGTFTVAAKTAGVPFTLTVYPTPRQSASLVTTTWGGLEDQLAILSSNVHNFSHCVDSTNAIIVPAAGTTCAAAGGTETTDWAKVVVPTYVARASNSANNCALTLVGQTSIENYKRIILAARLTVNNSKTTTDTSNTYAASSGSGISMRYLYTVLNDGSVSTSSTDSKRTYWASSFLGTPTVSSTTPSAVSTTGGLVTVTGTNFGPVGPYDVNTGASCSPYDSSNRRIATCLFPEIIGDSTQGCPAEPCTSVKGNIVSKVYIGGNECTGAKVVSTTSLTCTAPAGNGTGIGIWVVTSQSSSTASMLKTGTAANVFNYSGPTVVGIVAPVKTCGPNCTSNVLTILGTNFGAPGTTTVSSSGGGFVKITFTYDASNPVACTNAAVIDTKARDPTCTTCPSNTSLDGTQYEAITCTPPAGVGSGHAMQVQVQGQASSASNTFFSYIAPSITSQATVSFIPVNLLTVTGDNFGPACGGTGTACITSGTGVKLQSLVISDPSSTTTVNCTTSFQVVSDTQIVCKPPSMQTTVAAGVFGSSDTTKTYNLTVNAGNQTNTDGANKFKYLAPSITAITAYCSAAAGCTTPAATLNYNGDDFQITGTNLGITTSTVVVYFGTYAMPGGTGYSVPTGGQSVAVATNDTTIKGYAPDYITTGNTFTPNVYVTVDSIASNTLNLASNLYQGPALSSTVVYGDQFGYGINGYVASSDVTSSSIQSTDVTHIQADGSWITITGQNFAPKYGFTPRPFNTGEKVTINGVDVTFSNSATMTYIYDASTIYIRHSTAIDSTGAVTPQSGTGLPLAVTINGQVTATVKTFTFLGPYISQKVTTGSAVYTEGGPITITGKRIGPTGSTYFNASTYTSAGIWLCLSSDCTSKVACTGATVTTVDSVVTCTLDPTASGSSPQFYAFGNELTGWAGAVTGSLAAAVNGRIKMVVAYTGDDVTASTTNTATTNNGHGFALESATASGTGKFTVSAPVITSISPSTGLYTDGRTTAGSNVITITGHDFGGGNGTAITAANASQLFVRDVTINGKTCQNITVVTGSANSYKLTAAGDPAIITCQPVADIGSNKAVKVVVGNPADQTTWQSSNVDKTVSFGTPIVTDVFGADGSSPNRTVPAAVPTSPGYNVVTIQGINFGATGSTVQVMFDMDGNVATTGDQVTCATPTTAGACGGSNCGVTACAVSDASGNCLGDYIRCQFTAQNTGSLGRGFPLRIIFCDADGNSACDTTADPAAGGATGLGSQTGTNYWLTTVRSTGASNLGTVSGQTVLNVTLAFTPPAITGITVAAATDGWVGTSTLTITGTNFGSLTTGNPSNTQVAVQILHTTEKPTCTSVAACGTTSGSTCITCSYTCEGQASSPLPCVPNTDRIVAIKVAGQMSNYYVWKGGVLGPLIKSQANGGVSAPYIFASTVYPITINGYRFGSTSTDAAVTLDSIRYCDKTTFTSCSTDNTSGTMASGNWVSMTTTARGGTAPNLYVTGQTPAHSQTVGDGSDALTVNVRFTYSATLCNSSCTTSNPNNTTTPCAGVQGMTDWTSTTDWNTIVCTSAASGATTQVATTYSTNSTPSAQDNGMAALEYKAPTFYTSVDSALGSTVRVASQTQDGANFITAHTTSGTYTTTSQAITLMGEGFGNVVNNTYINGVRIDTEAATGTYFGPTTYSATVSTSNSFVITLPDGIGITLLTVQFSCDAASQLGQPLPNTSTSGSATQSTQTAAAASQAQVDTIVLSGTYETGDTVKVTVNGTTVSYLVVVADFQYSGAAATNAQVLGNIATNLAAALAGNATVSAAVTATANSSTATVTLTSTCGASCTASTGFTTTATVVRTAITASDYASLTCRGTTSTLKILRTAPAISSSLQTVGGAGGTLTFAGTDFTTPALVSSTSLVTAALYSGTSLYQSLTITSITYDSTSNTFSMVTTVPAGTGTGYDVHVTVQLCSTCTAIVGISSGKVSFTLPQITNITSLPTLSTQTTVSYTYTSGTGTATDTLTGAWITIPGTNFGPNLTVAQAAQRQLTVSFTYNGAQTTCRSPFITNSQVDTTSGIQSSDIVCSMACLTGESNCTGTVGSGGNYVPSFSINGSAWAVNTNSKVFSYAAPTITTTNSVNIWGTGVVTITGTNFGPTDSSTVYMPAGGARGLTVAFSSPALGLASTACISPTVTGHATITCTPPNLSGQLSLTNTTVTVTVTVGPSGNTQSVTANYTFSPPVVSTVGQPSVFGGVITIVGTDFSQTDQNGSLGGLYISGLAVSNLTPYNAQVTTTKIVLTFPSSSGGTIYSNTPIDVVVGGVKSTIVNASTAPVAGTVDPRYLNSVGPTVVATTTVPTSGGVVVIAGTGFPPVTGTVVGTGSDSVTVGTFKCTDAMSIDNTNAHWQTSLSQYNQMTCTLPAGTGKNKPVTMIFYTKTSSNDASFQGFSYAAPTVTSAVTSSGSTSLVPGSPITLNGTNFGTDASLVLVTAQLCSTPNTPSNCSTNPTSTCTNVTVTQTTVSCTLPVSTNTVGTTVVLNVTVDSVAMTTPYGITIAQPTITSILSGGAAVPPTGGVVTISGSNFGPLCGGTNPSCSSTIAAVTFGANAVACTSPSVTTADSTGNGTVITLTLPAASTAGTTPFAAADLGAGGMSVYVKVGPSATTAVSSAAYSFSFAAPTVTGITSSGGGSLPGTTTPSAYKGQTITVTGTNFGTATEGPVISIHHALDSTAIFNVQSSDIVSVSNTQIVFKAPSGYGYLAYMQINISSREATYTALSLTTTRPPFRFATPAVLPAAQQLVNGVSVFTTPTSIPLASNNSRGNTNGLVTIVGTGFGPVSAAGANGIQVVLHKSRATATGTVDNVRACTNPAVTTEDTVLVCELSTNGVGSGWDVYVGVGSKTYSPCVVQINVGSTPFSFSGADCQVNGFTYSATATFTPIANNTVGVGAWAFAPPVVSSVRFCQVGDTYCKNADYSQQAQPAVVSTGSVTSVAQVSTATFSGTWETNDVATLTIGTKAVSYTVVAADLTVNGSAGTAAQVQANVAAKLAAAITSDATAGALVTAVAASGVIRLTAKTGNLSITIAQSVTNGGTDNMQAIAVATIIPAAGTSTNKLYITGTNFGTASETITALSNTSVTINNAVQVWLVGPGDGTCTRNNVALPGVECKTATLVTAQTAIECVVPANIGVGINVLVEAGGQVGTTPTSPTTAQQVSFQAPDITSVTSSATQGSTITVTGTGFANLIPDTTVDSTSCYASWFTANAVQVLYKQSDTAQYGTSASCTSFAVATVNSVVQVTCTAPKGTGTNHSLQMVVRGVTFTANSGQAQSFSPFNYLAPTVTSVTAPPVLGGTITINGTNFGNVLSFVQVQIYPRSELSKTLAQRTALAATDGWCSNTGTNASLAVPTAAADTVNKTGQHFQLTCTVPSGIGYNFSVKVTVDSQDSGNTGDGLLAYLPPTIAPTTTLSTVSGTTYAVNPRVGNLVGLTTITIAGTNFGTPDLLSNPPSYLSTGAIQVWFSTDTAATANGASKAAATSFQAAQSSVVIYRPDSASDIFYIIAAVPVGAGKNVNVFVRADGQFSAASNRALYDFPPPVVTSTNVPSAAGGADTSGDGKGHILTITGQNFGPANTPVTSVMVGGYTCSSPVVVSSTSITCAMPAGNGSQYVVQVTILGSTSDPGTWRMRFRCPTVSAVSTTLTGAVAAAPACNGTDCAPGRTGQKVVVQAKELGPTTDIYKMKVKFLQPGSTDASLAYWTAVGTSDATSDLAFAPSFQQPDNQGVYTLLVTVPVGYGSGLPVVVEVNGQDSLGMCGDTPARSISGIDSSLKFSYPKPVILAADSVGTEGGVITVHGENFGPAGTQDLEVDQVSYAGINITCASAQVLPSYDNVRITCTMGPGLGSNNQLYVKRGPSAGPGGNQQVTSDAFTGFTYAAPAISQGGIVCYPATASNGLPDKSTSSSSCSAGDWVYITGTNFGNNPAQTVLAIFDPGLVDSKTNQPTILATASPPSNCSTATGDACTATLVMFKMPPLSGQKRSVQVQLLAKNPAYKSYAISSPFNATPVFFSYKPPTVDGANQVPTSGGTVTITGSHFGVVNDAVGVSIGTLTCANAKVTASDATTGDGTGIQCTLGAGVGGSMDVVVTVWPSQPTAQQTGFHKALFSYIAPTLTSVAGPGTGASTGAAQKSATGTSGQTLTLTGTNLGLNASDITVQFLRADQSVAGTCGSVPVVKDHTQITCVTPNIQGLNLAIVAVVGGQPSPTSGAPQFTFDLAGCKNPAAENYNPNATSDNGTCVIIGCTDPNALNYTPPPPNGTVKDGEWAEWDRTSQGAAHRSRGVGVCSLLPATYTATLCLRPQIPRARCASCRPSRSRCDAT